MSTSTNFDTIAIAIIMPPIASITNAKDLNISAIPAYLKPFAASDNAPISCGIIVIVDIIALNIFHATAVIATVTIAEPAIIMSVTTA